jgi:hypothetical protein
MKKTAVGGKDPLKAKTYAAGSNTLTREKRQSYDDYLATGSRADDPRNWEFHYKAPSASRMGPTKGQSAEERTTNAYSSARQKAERMAKLAGKDVYQVKKTEYETETLKGETKQAAANRKATSGGGFGSSRVAQSVVAQKQMANRKTGRAKASSPFEARTKNRVGIA